ncbi:MAG: GAF domain-containing protein [Methanobacterium sp. ERen5]|nr:MAG: GAF domain-containing protein [Methanobacterium sp. ERen5]
MLDKITRNTSRSRATILKYLGILNAKGILTYKFVGRSKLWSLTEESETQTYKTQQTQPSIASNDVISAITRLHSIKLEETILNTVINHQITIIFTVNNDMDIVISNNTFKMLFKETTNLSKILVPEQLLVVKKLGNSMNPTKTMELDLMEKYGTYTPYKMTSTPISDENNNQIGISFIGEELSQVTRSKRELEILLTITQKMGSAQSEESLMNEVTRGIEKLVDSNGVTVVLKENKKLYIKHDTTHKVKSNFKVYREYILEGMDGLETKTTTEKIYLDPVVSNTGTSPAMMVSIPIIYEETSIGALLVFTPSKPLGSITIENMEMVADELASHIKIQRLSQEKQEFTNTLLALNHISTILNTYTVEEEMLERSVASTMETLGFDMGCIYLADQEDELTLRVHKNLPTSLENMCIAGMFQDIFQESLEKQNIVYITSESEEYESLDSVISKAGIKSLLILPIKSGDRIIGLLNMGSRKIKKYNNISLENLSSIGLQLGLALEVSKAAFKRK